MLRIKLLSIPYGAPMADPRQATRRMKERGYTDDAVDLNLEKIHNLPPDLRQATLKDFYTTLADDATRCDILVELRLNIVQRSAAIEEITPTCQREDAPASAHNTRRLLLKDQLAALDILDQKRKAADRDRCVPAEKEAADKAQAQAEEEREWKHMGMLRDNGYYFVPGIGMEQPESCLDPEIVAVRDAVRLRHLPKSPYEDRILAEYYGATFPQEKDINPDTLLKKEMESDEFSQDPTRGIRMGRYQDGPRDRLTARLVAERIRVRNELLAQAEARLDEIDRTKGSIWACPCCRDKVSSPWGWIDEPEHLRATSPWRLPPTGWNVSIKTLLWATIVGWLFAQQLCATALPPFEPNRSASHPAKPCEPTNALVTCTTGDPQSLFTATSPARGGERVAPPVRAGSAPSVDSRAPSAATEAPGLAAFSALQPPRWGGWEESLVGIATPPSRAGRPSTAPNGARRGDQSTSCRSIAHHAITLKHEHQQHPPHPFFPRVFNAFHPPRLL
jgi:hypothetical protein